MEGAGIPSEEVDHCAQRFRAIHKEASLWRVVRPGTLEALDRFRARGFKLAVVSNAEGNVESDARRYGIRSHFDAVIDSFVVGVSKPDPRIFKIALDEIGVAPQQALFAGDIYSIDMIGAQTAGMRGKLIDAMGLYSWIDHVKIRGVHEFHALNDEP
jgi:putative hydrolase of the HAD superfamily